jgi:signal transduction histidine kinase
VNERWAERPIVVLGRLNNTWTRGKQREERGLTADSLPSRIAEALGVEPTPAADAQLSCDLLAAARQHDSVLLADDHVRLALETVQRAFGRQILDERVRPSAEAAVTRAARLAEAAGRLSEPVLYAFTAELFVSLAVERPWREKDTQQLLSQLKELFEASRQEVAVQLLTASLRASQLLELPPTVALDAQLGMLRALAPVAEASIWGRGDDGRPECVLSSGDTTTTRRFRAIALRTLEGDVAAGDRGLIVGVPVRRWQTPWGALVVRVRSREAVEAILEEASVAMSPIVERDFLLQRGAEREHTLVKASERRLSRLGFDLHDGALQDLAMLGTDLGRLRPQLQGGAGEAGLDAIVTRISELDRVLRELAHSLEPASLLRRPIERVIEAEAATLTERTGIEVHARVSGDFGATTQSQRIALIRIVQEALTNIREHSNASQVELVLTGSRSCVELLVTDDGDGFEVTRTLQSAAQRGRLGLVGSSERIRLLGGTFDIRSKPGGPTTIAVTLPRWQPLVEQTALQLAY